VQGPPGARASPNITNVADMTPLHWAAAKFHVELVGLLLKHGADRRLRNCDGMTPFDIVRVNYGKRTPDDQYRLLQKLLEG